PHWGDPRWLPAASCAGPFRPRSSQTALERPGFLRWRVIVAKLLQLPRDVLPARGDTHEQFQVYLLAEQLLQPLPSADTDASDDAAATSHEDRALTLFLHVNRGVCFDAFGVFVDAVHGHGNCMWNFGGGRAKHLLAHELRNEKACRTIGECVGSVAMRQFWQE